MASQLLCYQEALEHLGERPLASLSEDREPRRALDAAWDTTVKYCIEQGFWNWSLRSVGVTPEAGLATTWGYANAFLKPDDWLRTFVVSESENFEFPTEQFIDENGYWFADPDTIYVRFVSSHPGFGGNLAVWPETFTTYVATRLARRICRRISNSAEMYKTLFELESRAKLDAMSKDAMNEGTKRMPSGTWVRSRGSYSQSSRWDRTFR